MSTRRQVELTLTIDQALVLSDWLERVMPRDDFSTFVDDRAVWSPLLKISGTLETNLPEVFDPSYKGLLEQARGRLVSELGDFGL